MAKKSKRILQERKEYTKLSESSKKTLSVVLYKVAKSGKTVQQLRNMNEKDFRKFYGTKAKDWKAQQRRLSQVIGSVERKNELIDLTYKKYEKDYISQKDKKKFKIDLTKTSGNTFQAVLDNVETNRTFVNKQEAYDYVRKLLKTPTRLIDNLIEVDKEAIEGYDTTP